MGDWSQDIGSELSTFFNRVETNGLNMMPAFAVPKSGEAMSDWLNKSITAGKKNGAAAMNTALDELISQTGSHLLAISARTPLGKAVIPPMSPDSKRGLMTKEDQEKVQAAVLEAAEALPNRGGITGKTIKDDLKALFESKGNPAYLEPFKKHMAAYATAALHPPELQKTELTPGKLRAPNFPSAHKSQNMLG
jgi:hypothetical protein